MDETFALELFVHTPTVTDSSIPITLLLVLTPVRNAVAVAAESGTCLLVE